MAGKGYTVGIGSDTKAFKQGVDVGIIKPLEDAQRELKELGNSTAPHKLEQQMRDVQQQTRDVASETKRTADTIEREYRDSYRKAGKASEDFSRGASDNVAGFKDEAVQNLSEVASSFTGDMSQMADGVQGLTGGLASSLTPGIGIPIAIIGGIAGAFLASWQRTAEDQKKLISDMYDDMAASGSAFLSEDFIQQGLKKIFSEQYDTVISRSKEMGETHETIARAMAGDEAAINEILGDQERKRTAAIQQIRDSGKSLSDQATAVDGVNAKYGTQNGWLLEIQRATDTAATKAKDLSKTISDLTTPRAVDLVVNADFSDFTRKFAQAQRDAVQGLNVGVAFRGRLWD